MIESDFREKYRYANKMSDNFHFAERKGYLKPGSRAKANETILVSRKEAEQMAHDLGSALYSSHFRLYENLEYAKFIERISEGAEDAVTCADSHTVNRDGWGVGCPVCMVGRVAKAQIDRELNESEEGGVT